MIDKFEADPVAVCWSGGWDSTFRVLELILRYGCRVQPIYVVDPNRRSQNHEIAAMDKVRSELTKMYPAKSKLLFDTRYFNADEIDVPEPNRSQFQSLRSSHQVGWQYYWLSTVGDETGYAHVEVMVHGNDTAPMWQFLRENVDKKGLPCGASTYILRDWEPADEFAEGMALFKKFSYPTINVPKPSMEDIAKEHGFFDLMLHTWFCHFPLGNEPCGMCYTCRYVIYDGLAKRFPKSALLRNRVWFIVHPVRVSFMEPRRTIDRVKNLAIWTRAKVFRGR